MSFGKYKQPDKVFPAQPGGVGTSAAHTVSGASRFTVHYPSAVGQKLGLTAMTIRQGADELDGAFAARLHELSRMVTAMLLSTDSTAFTALDVRRAALADA